MRSRIVAAAMPFALCAGCAAWQRGGVRTFYDGPPRHDVLLAERGWNECGELAGDREDGTWLCYRIENGRPVVGKVMFFRDGEQVGLQFDGQDPAWFVTAIDGGKVAGFQLLLDPVRGAKVLSYRDRDADRGWHADFEGGKVLREGRGRAQEDPRGLDPTATTLSGLVRREPSPR